MQLQTSAVLLSVSVNQFGRNRTDKKITGKVLRENNAPDTAGRFNKCLLPKEDFKEVEDAVTALDDFVKDNTDPWETTEEGAPAQAGQEEKGPQRAKFRIVSMRNFSTTMDGIRERIRRFEGAAERFVACFEEKLDAWRPKLNGLYDPNDYPRDKAGNLDLRKIRGRFKVTMNVIEMPDLAGNKFLGVLKDQFGVAQEMIDQVASDNARLKAEMEEQLRLSPYRRLAEMLVKIVQRQKQWEQLWPQLQSELTTLEKFGVMDDPDFEKLRKMTVDDLANAYPPGSFENNMPARDQAREKAKAILEKMSQYV